MKKNIFVIGDLVIDHTIFVKSDPERPHQAVENEAVYEVLRRQDNAGGAANTARILSVINKGKTFLWGIIGESVWGDFRHVLMTSDNPDETSMPIEFRGTKDETNAQMNTITRIIQIDLKSPSPSREHKVRYDDYGNSDVTHEKRRSALYYLRRANEEYGIDAIIINDLDYGCLTREMIKEISEYAHSHNPPIPLFIDPKRDKSKYENIEATAVLPNLREWCHIVGKPGTHDQWRERLDKPVELSKMAELSFSQLRKIKYHIIKCDREGAVIISPHQQQRNLYTAYHILPMETTTPNPPHQLGCGDIMTGVFALECAGGELTPERALKAFLRANAAVKCYREMPWHKMPSVASVVKSFEKVEKQNLPKPIIEVSIGRLFLPEERTIMSEHMTDIPGLYSQDSTFCSSITSLIDDISTRWSPALFRSIILGARSGSGKSTIAKWLREELPKKQHIHVEDLTADLLNKLNGDNLEYQFNHLMKKMPEGCNKMLIIVDEALKGEQATFLRNSGVHLLNMAHEKNIRFLFIDADFDFTGEKHGIGSQFTSRCRFHRLSSLAKRPTDIPIITAAHIFSWGNRSAHVFNCLRIQGNVLLNIINMTLATPNPRVLCDLAGGIMENAMKREIKSGKIELIVNDQKELQYSADAQNGDMLAFYEFFDF